jgi:single-strand DNA-binding protein
MANFNRIILCGNLTRDPQVKFLPNQTQLCEFGLAVNRKFKVNGEDREEVLFIDCVLFGKGAEVVNQYCVKGGQILVEGRLKLDTWEDKQGGGKRSKHSVIVESFQLMGGKRDGDPTPRRDAGTGYRQPSRQQTRQPTEPDLSTQEFSVDDIPF